MDETEEIFINEAPIQFEEKNCLRETWKNFYFLSTICFFLSLYRLIFELITMWKQLRVFLSAMVTFCL